MIVMIKALFRTRRCCFVDLNEDMVKRGADARENGQVMFLTVSYYG
jgi:hypothetical protein